MTDGWGSPMSNIIIELTEAEREYIWLLTALDAMRIGSMETEEQKDYHYQVRHSVRSKLFGEPYNKPLSITETKIIKPGDFVMITISGSRVCMNQRHQII